MSLSLVDCRAGVTVLVGNPARGSRTSTVAKVVAAGIAADDPAGPEVIELAALGPALLSGGQDQVRGAIEKIESADILVVATPVYKAGYTGLLKLFLDEFDATALESTVVIPVVLTASAAHGALAELQLRIVLQALGGVLPVPSFVLEEHHLDHLTQYVDAWQQRFGRVVSSVADALCREQVGAS